MTFDHGLLTFCFRLRPRARGLWLGRRPQSACRVLSIWKDACNVQVQRGILQSVDFTLAHDSPTPHESRLPWKLSTFLGSLPRELQEDYETTVQVQLPNCYSYLYAKPENYILPNWSTLLDQLVDSSCLSLSDHPVVHQVLLPPWASYRFYWVNHRLYLGLEGPAGWLFLTIPQVDGLPTPAYLENLDRVCHTFLDQSASQEPQVFVGQLRRSPQRYLSDPLKRWVQIMEVYTCSPRKRKQDLCYRKLTLRSLGSWSQEAWRAIAVYLNGLWPNRRLERRVGPSLLGRPPRLGLVEVQLDTHCDWFRLEHLTSQHLRLLVPYRLGSHLVPWDYMQPYHVQPYGPVQASWELCLYYLNQAIGHLPLEF